MSTDQASDRTVDPRGTASGDRIDASLRSVQRSRRHAWLLAVGVGCVSLVVAGVIAHAMIQGLGGGAPRMELMSLGAVVEAAKVEVAPSRRAPSFVPPPTAAELAAQEAALREATQDAGPALGAEVQAPETADPAATWAAGPTFDGRPLRAVKTLRMLTTAYSPDERSCGAFADGITASGYSVWTNGMKLVAADTSLLPFGTIVSIPGYHGGRPVPVLDRGGRIKGARLDVLYPTHETALKWGAQRLDVTVWEYADQ